MVPISRDTFDRHDLFPDRFFHGNAAGSGRLTIDMYRARTALSNAAAELRACHAEVIADHPQQWSLRVGINGVRRSIHVQIERHPLPPLDCRIVFESLTINQLMH
jgi:hypothetical protein